jgi:hypothetical protein
VYKGTKSGVRHDLPLLVCLRAAAVAVALISAGCFTNRDRTVEPTSTIGSTLAAGRTSAYAVLLPTTAELRRQCAVAAERLAITVPCPTQLPGTNGETPSCEDSCTFTDPYPLFVIHAQDFDTASTTGLDDEVRHVVIEARPASDAPRIPCTDSTIRDHETIGGDKVTVYTCRGGSTRYGEGIHLDHTLLAWRRPGARYAVSVHSDTTEALSMLQQIVRTIRYVGP